jgi:3-isopropylmalate/(R)-2-methylmalate dehydratase large subunit
MGAVGAFGQGMGDQDIAAVWAKGKAWFKVPESVKIQFNGKRPANISAKDIVLNMLSHFGANTLLGYAVELYGEAIEGLTLDERITISSMATEMGAIIILIPPVDKVIDELEQRSGKRFDLIAADEDAVYAKEYQLDISEFKPMLAKPGHPHDNVAVQDLDYEKIDSAFIGSCTNGRLEDLRIAAYLLKDKKVAPGVVLKIVPSTDAIWNEALNEGLIKIFKNAGALVSNAGCAGCAAGQVGQNGPNEVTISTGNRNFAGKQGKGKVYLASPEVVAASAIAGYITTPDNIPEKASVFTADTSKQTEKKNTKKSKEPAPSIVEGRVWFIQKDDIDTDMIFHNRYLTITDINEMGQYTFDNLEGYEDFAQKAQKGDIIVTTKNFGAGSSRQQAVDCFKSLGVQCIIAESFGAIYERNAINAAFPILTYSSIDDLELETGNTVRVDYVSGTLTNLDKDKECSINKFFDVQLEIYKNGGLL